MQLADRRVFGILIPRLSVSCFCVLIALAPRLGFGQEKIQLFVDEVRFKNFPSNDQDPLEPWRSALAAEITGALEVAPRFSPVTLENLEAQLGKERLKATLACEDSNCVNRIVENFGCSETLFPVVRYISKDKAQVTVTHTAEGEKVASRGPLVVPPTYEALASALRSLSRDLFGLPMANGAGTIVRPPSVIVGNGSVVESGKVTVAVADMAILAEPKNLVRLEITDPKGKKVVSGAPYKNRSAAPGTWRVKAEATGYEEYIGTFTAPPDDVTVHRIELKKFGGLEVTGKPAGAKVNVTGPDGFSHSGGLPWRAQGIRSGTYQVMVHRDGYQELRRSVVVSPGATARVPVSLSTKKTPASTKKQETTTKQTTWGFGALVGGDLSMYLGNTNAHVEQLLGEDSSTENDMMFGYTAGVLGYYSPRRFVSFQMELLYTRKGAIVLDDEYSDPLYRTTIGYIEVPVYAKFKIDGGGVGNPPNKYLLTLSAGMYFAGKVSEKVASQREVLKERPNRAKDFDCGVLFIFGNLIGIWPGSFFMDVRVTLGVVKVYDDKVYNLTGLGVFGFQY